MNRIDEYFNSNPYEASLSVVSVKFQMGWVIMPCISLVWIADPGSNIPDLLRVE